MRNQLYKLLISDVTNHCYKNCLNYFPDNSIILDVGIGNGSMMKNYHSLIRSKNLTLIGIDINKSYLKHCEKLIKTYFLENHVKIYHEAAETYQPPQKGYFDFILFSMSFMLFADQKLILDRVKEWLKPGGMIVFFQTIFQNNFRLMEFVKPKLKYFTSVDFGRVTYEEDFFDLLKEKHISVLEEKSIEKKWFKGEYRMIVTSINSMN